MTPAREEAGKVEIRELQVGEYDVGGGEGRGIRDNGMWKGYSGRRGKSGRLQGVGGRAFGIPPVPDPSNHNTWVMYML